ncbi:hypothetical protein Tco_0384261, partial [Tanacetum coccineum]
MLAANDITRKRDSTELSSSAFLDRIFDLVQLVKIRLGELDNWTLEDLNK